MTKEEMIALERDYQERVMLERIDQLMQFEQGIT
jgi:hypothetical protein